MKLSLQIVFILASIFTFIFVITRIRKHKLNIEDSIAWIIWAIILLIISVFPDILVSISKFLGFQSTSNFVLCLFIFYLYIMLFLQNIKISELNEKNKDLVQKMSIKNKEK